MLRVSSLRVYSFRLPERVNTERRNSEQCIQFIHFAGDAQRSAANLLYLGVLGVGLLGALSTRFAPRGMARATFAMAIAQLLVPVIVLLIPNLRGVMWEPPGPIGVFGINTCFAALFVGAALLFRQAAQAQLTASPRTD